jgi:hypothetical protein
VSNLKSYVNDFIFTRHFPKFFEVEPKKMLGIAPCCSEMAMDEAHVLAALYPSQSEAGQRSEAGPLLCI